MVLEFLETPNLESPLEPDIAKEMREHIDRYEAAARKMAESAPRK